MPRELSAFLLTDWFQVEHKSNSLSVSTLILHTHTGRVNTSGISCLICCSRSGRKWFSCWDPFILSQAIENQFYFFHPSLTYSIFFDISWSIKGQKPNIRKNTNFSSWGPTNTLHVSVMSSRFPFPLRWPASSETIHWIVMSSRWYIHLPKSICMLLRILIFISWLVSGFLESPNFHPNLALSLSE